MLRGDRLCPRRTDRFPGAGRGIEDPFSARGMAALTAAPARIGRGLAGKHQPLFCPRRVHSRNEVQLHRMPSSRTFCMPWARPISSSSSLTFLVARALHRSAGAVLAGKP